MPAAPSTPLRRLLGVVAAIVMFALFAATARADDPHVADVWFDLPVERPGGPATSQLGDLFSWQAGEGAYIQQVSTCDQLVASGDGEREIGLIFTDANLIAESDGSRLCIVYDYLWGSYEAWLINQESVEEFRRTKSQLQPLLPVIGLHPCHIVRWTPVDQEIRRRIGPNDLFDAGERCNAEIITHGPESEGRIADVADAIRASEVTAAEVFQWTPTWPLRVHVYDTQEDFVAGVRREGGYRRANSQSLEDARAAARILANGQFGFLLNAGPFRSGADLHRVIAHEFAHVAQAGLLGGTNTRLPFFVVEGGAEYFASLVVGADHQGLTLRFQEAVNDEHAGRAVPLAELVQEPSDSDRRRVFASYSRGYAAMVMLTDRWGRDSFTRLHIENIDGSPERFLQAMTRLTGLTLDEFDATLKAYLLVRPPMSIGPESNRAMLAPNSLLAGAFTARQGSGGSIEQAERFTSQDSAVLVLFDWNCLRSAVRGEARLIAPDGQPFATFGGTSGPGCNVRGGLEFPLDSTSGGRVARDYLGTWTVEIYADGLFQGSVTFVLE